VFDSAAQCCKVFYTVFQRLTNYVQLKVWPGPKITKKKYKNFWIFCWNLTVSFGNGIVSGFDIGLRQ